MPEPLVYPVVSNAYEIASCIVKNMLQKGLISKREYEKIDAKNRQTFIA